jgi:16S rRNA (guanine(966)-N(2))-methyltransferase RsmD
MRIISGKYRGRNIPVRKDFPSRPTTDFAKENLFNVLNNCFEFEGLKILDLFAGTGSISYEFASRGCEAVISIEKDYKSYSFIKTIVNDFGFNEITAVKMDAFKYIEKSTESFDIIFADPPFNLESLSDLPEKVLNSEILKEHGWFILEHGKKHQFNDNQHLKEIRNYGSVNFSIFKR